MNVQFPVIFEIFGYRNIGSYLREILCGVGNICHAGDCWWESVRPLTLYLYADSSRSLFFCSHVFIGRSASSGIIDPSGIGVFTGFPGIFQAGNRGYDVFFSIACAQIYQSNLILEHLAFQTVQMTLERLVLHEGRFIILLVVISRICLFIVFVYQSFGIFKWFVLAVELDRCIEYGDGFYGLSWFW